MPDEGAPSSGRVTGSKIIGKSLRDRLSTTPQFPLKDHERASTAVGAPVSDPPIVPQRKRRVSLRPRGSPESLTLTDIEFERPEEKATRTNLILPNSHFKTSWDWLVILLVRGIWLV